MASICEDHIPPCGYADRFDAVQRVFAIGESWETVINDFGTVEKTYNADVPTSVSLLVGWIVGSSQLPL